MSGRRTPNTSPRARTSSNQSSPIDDTEPLNENGGGRFFSAEHNAWIDRRNNWPAGTALNLYQASTDLTALARVVVRRSPRGFPPAFVDEDPNPDAPDNELPTYTRLPTLGEHTQAGGPDIYSELPVLDGQQFVDLLNRIVRSGGIDAYHAELRATPQDTEERRHRVARAINISGEAWLRRPDQVGATPQGSHQGSSRRSRSTWAYTDVGSSGDLPRLQPRVFSPQRTSPHRTHSIRTQPWAESAERHSGSGRHAAGPPGTSPMRSSASSIGRDIPERAREMERHGIATGIPQAISPARKAALQRRARQLRNEALAREEDAMMREG